MAGSMLEALLTSPDGFGLTTASPLQRAICRLADGVPLGDLATEETVIEAIGDPRKLPTTPPKEITLLGAVRCGKSLLAAASGVRATQICDVSRLAPGEVARVSILSVRVDQADVVFGLIKGHVLARPKLKALLVDEPGADSLLLRHPSGRPVEIKVSAGARAGATLVGRWSAGCIFDEAARMLGAEEATINLDDARSAVLARLLAGAQCIYISSPWQPYGPIFDMVQEHWGKPSPNLVVIRAKAAALNPVYWTPQRIARLRQHDPDVARTDVDCEFRERVSAMFNLVDIAKCTRASPVEIEPRGGQMYRAAMDPGTRGNSWTLIIATMKAAVAQVVLAKQWTGSRAAPLSPESVMKEIAGICGHYGIHDIATDQYSGDAIKDIGARYKLQVEIETTTAGSKTERFESLRIKLADGKVELPPVEEVLDDLKRVQKRITNTGVAIELPRTADGRHADYAPAIANVIAKLSQPVLMNTKTVFYRRDSIFDGEQHNEYDMFPRQAPAYGGRFGGL